MSLFQIIKTLKFVVCEATLLRGLTSLSLFHWIAW